MDVAAQIARATSLHGPKGAALLAAQSWFTPEIRRQESSQRRNDSGLAHDED
jgi:hypothetical protein